MSEIGGTYASRRCYTTCGYVGFNYVPMLDQCALSYFVRGKYHCTIVDLLFYFFRFTFFAVV